MAAFVPFEPFVEGLAEGAFDLGSDTLKIALSNAAPTASWDHLADVTQIAAGNGYVAGGFAVTVTSSSQTGGTYKLVLEDLVIAASGGSMAGFRYLIFYDDTHANDALIGYWDYGSELILADGESLTANFDPTDGALVITS